MNWTILPLLGFVVHCLYGDCMYVNPFRVLSYNMRSIN